jgi:alpha-glucosidase
MKLLLSECVLPAHLSFAEARLSLRLHVNVFDKSVQQSTMPSGFFNPPKSENLSTPAVAARGVLAHDDGDAADWDSDLQFDYEASPFAFWITRRSDPGSAPIFDTRLTSLPSAPIPAFRSGRSDPSLVFDGFPLVFEDRYLQVTYGRHTSIGRH